MLLLAGPLKKRIAQTFRLGSLWILSHNTFDQTFMTKGISVVKIAVFETSNFQMTMDVKVWSRKRKASITKKCSEWGYFHAPRFLEFLDLRLISLGHSAMPIWTRTGKRIEVTKIIVPVQMSLIQVRLWVNFLLESPAIVACRVTTNRRSGKIYSTSEGSWEVQI